MAAGTYLVLSCVAAALEGLWLGCQDVWGENPVRGYRLERRCRALGEAISERSRGLSDEEIILSPEIEDLWRQNDRAIIAHCLHKGIDPFAGGIARMYWEGRRRTQEQRQELLHPKPPTSAQAVADALYDRLRGQRSPAVALAHTRAIGTSPRLALPPSR